jgi:hypothetical protein
VITHLNQGHNYGPLSPAASASSLGGSLDGTLRQYGCFNEQGLVRAPSNVSFQEASTLVCAGVTSWNALYGLKALRPGQWVLLLGSGGVSLFALQVSCSVFPLSLSFGAIESLTFRPSSPKPLEPQSSPPPHRSRKRQPSESSAQTISSITKTILRGVTR